MWLTNQTRDKQRLIKRSESERHTKIIAESGHSRVTKMSGSRYLNWTTRWHRLGVRTGVRSYRLNSSFISLFGSQNYQIRHKKIILIYYIAIPREYCNWRQWNSWKYKKNQNSRKNNRKASQGNTWEKHVDIKIPINF